MNKAYELLYIALHNKLLNDNRAKHSWVNGVIANIDWIFRDDNKNTISVYVDKIVYELCNNNAGGCGACPLYSNLFRDVGIPHICIVNSMLYHTGKRRQ